MNAVGAFKIMPIGTDGMIFVLPQHISVVFSEHRKINGVARQPQLCWTFDKWILVRNLHLRIIHIDDCVKFSRAELAVIKMFKR